MSTIATASRPGAPQRHRRRRELVGAAQDERAVGPLAQLALADQHLGELAPARAQRRRVGGLQRPFVRGAQQVRGVQLLVLVVEDRGLDRPLQELVGMAAEELVERVLAGDVDREPAAAPPGPAPHLAQRGDGPRERHADRGIQRPDVDPQLQRIGRHDAEQLAVHQPPLELAPLRRRVARPVRRDPLGQGRVPAPLQLQRREVRHQLDRLARLHEHDRARALDHQLREQVGGLGRAASAARPSRHR